MIDFAINNNWQNNYSVPPKLLEVSDMVKPYAFQNEELV